MFKQPVKLPIIFSAQVRNGRERNFRETWFGEWVDFEIGVCDTTEAPVAAEWTVKDISKLKKACVRVSADQFYVPMLTRHGGEQASVSTLSNETDIQQGLAPVASLFANATLSRERTAFTIFMKGQMTTGTLGDQKEYYADTREETLSQARAILNDVLVIDGMLWTKSVEPVLSLTSSHSRRDAHVEYAIEFPSRAYASTGHKFRLTEWEAMVAFGDLLVPASEELGNRWVFDKVCDLEIHIPEAFKAKVDLDAMAKLASDVLALRKDEVMDLGREATTYWHDVKEQLEETLSTKSNADLDLLKTVTERLILATEREETSRFRREISAMSDRLDNRIIERPVPGLGR